MSKKEIIELDVKVHDKNKGKYQVEIKGENKKKMDIYDWIPIIISLLAFVSSVVMFFMQRHYAELEYKYKIDPDTNIHIDFEIKSSEDENGRKYVTEAKKVEFNVINKNNIDKFYFITRDNKVEKAELKDRSEKDIEKILKDKLENKLSFSDITTDNYEYRYLFLISKSLDENIDINIILAKSKIYYPDKDFKNEGAEIRYSDVDNIELYEWENADEDDEDYKGEKEILKQYRQILKWVEENDI